MNHENRKKNAKNDVLLRVCNVAPIWKIKKNACIQSELMICYWKVNELKFIQCKYYYTFIVCAHQFPIIFDFDISLSCFHFDNRTFFFYYFPFHWFIFTSVLWFQSYALYAIIYIAHWEYINSNTIVIIAIGECNEKRL